MAHFSPKSLAASLVHVNTRIFRTQTNKDTRSNCIYVSDAFLNNSQDLDSHNWSLVLSLTQGLLIFLMSLTFQASGQVLTAISEDVRMVRGHV